MAETKPTGSEVPSIEKNVPLPPPRRRTGYTDILRKLQIGDSVVLPTLGWRVHSIAFRTLGKGCFRTRKEGGGTRVWRIK